MSFNVGDTVGDYQVIGLLGTGGMGRVYKIRNLISDRVEAMKVVLPDLENQAQMADRFLREIKLQASLDHPNIARLYSALRINNQLLMIMELVEGVSLGERIHNGPPVTPRLAVDCVCQMLSALGYAHRGGIIHRDIKPANMILTPSGVVKLLDFGIAKATEDFKLTATGQAIGSLYYMSPEQVRGQVPDARSDLYSLGVTLYQLVTGKRPIDGSNEYAIMTAQLEQAVVPPAEVNPKLHPKLSEVMLKSLTKEPAERFQTADEFRQALASAPIFTEPSELDNADTATVTAPPSLPSLPAPETGQPKDRRTLGVAAGALAAVALIGVGAFYWLNRRPAPAVEHAAKEQPATAAPAPAPQAPPVVITPPASERAAKTPPPAPARKTPPPSSSAARVEKSRPVEQKAEQKAVIAAPPPAPAEVPVAVSTDPRPKTPEKAPPPPNPVPIATVSSNPAPKSPPRPAPAPDPRAVELAEWERLNGSRDLAVLEDFRRKYPGGPLSQQAAARIEQIEWDAARNSKDPAALRAFRSKHPNGPHAAQALAEIGRLEREADARSVLEVLRRYQAAYENRSVEGIRAVWPGLGQTEINKISNSFKATRSYKVILQPTGDPQISGDTATVACKRSIWVQFKEESRPKKPVEDSVIISLRKSGTSWIIESLQ
jgi:serine/threonine protein kinase